MYGNASEVPDSESGETGVYSAVQFDNGSAEPSSPTTQTTTVTTTTVVGPTEEVAEDVSGESGPAGTP